jgi:hypothetical protein
VVVQGNYHRALLTVIDRSIVSSPFHHHRLLGDNFTHLIKVHVAWKTRMFTHFVAANSDNERSRSVNCTRSIRTTEVLPLIISISHWGGSLTSNVLLMEDMFRGSGRTGKFGHSKLPCCRQSRVFLHDLSPQAHQTFIAFYSLHDGIAMLNKNGGYGC